MTDLVSNSLDLEIPEFETSSPQIQAEEAPSSDQENQPPKGRKRAKKHVPQNDSLYDALLASTSINTLIKDWIGTFKLNSSDAIQEIVQFLIHASGCTLQVNEEAIKDPDLITDALDSLESQYTPTDYPLLKGKKGTAKFKSRFQDFWTKLVLALKSEILYEEEVGVLVQWLATMSSSASRAFRHTSTLASLCVLTGLCQVNQSMIQEMNKLSLQVEKRRKNDVQERIVVLESNKSVVEGLMSDLFDGVFVHRYRDTDPLIRADCIHELGSWIAKCPSSFLDSQYLRYLGWMLNDKVGSVRVNCVKAMGVIMNPDLSSGLRSFAERFKGRLIGMALYEKEQTVRIEVIKVLTKMNELGFLDEVDTEKISVLIMDADARIRDCVSAFVVDYWKQEFMEPLSELVENRSSSKQVSLLKEKIVLKSVCQMLIRISERAREIAKEVMKTEGMKVAESLTELPRFASTQPHVDVDPLVSFEMDGIVSWIKRYPSINETVGFESVNSATCALIDQDIGIEDTDQIIDYLKTETDPDDHTSLLNLSEEQTSCLLYILGSVLTMSAETTSKTKADQEKMANAQNCLLNQVSYLLNRYGKEFSGAGFDILLECATLLNLINVDFVSRQRLTQPLEELTKKLVELFLLHTSPVMLKEIAGVLGMLSITESTDTSVISLTNNCKMVVNETVEGLLGELASLAMELNESPQEDLHSQGVMRILQGLGNGLNRLHQLASCFPVFRSPATDNFEFDRQTNGTFALMNACLEGTLQVLKAHVDSPTDQSSSFYHSCNEILYCALKLMAAEYVDSMAKLLEDTEASQELIELTKGKQDRLFNFLEAVASDANGEFFQIQFTYLQRLFCLETLLDISPILSGKAIQQYPMFARRLSSKFQEEASLLVKNLVRLATFDLPLVNQEVSDEQLAEFRYSIHEVVGSLIVAATRKELKFQTLSHVLSLYGYSNDSGRIWPLLSKGELSEDQWIVAPFVLGDVWNGMCDHFIKRTVGDFPLYLGNLFEMDLEQELKMNRIQEYCVDIFKMMTDSLQKAIELYMTKRPPSLFLSENLAKTFVSSLRTWTNQLSDVTFGKHTNNATNRSPVIFIQKARDIIARELLLIFADGIKSFGTRLSLWKRLADKAEMDVDMTFQTTFDDTDRNELLKNWPDAKEILIDTAPVQEGWNIWSVLAGGVSHLLSHFQLSDDAVPVSDIIENIKEHISSLDLDQVEEGIESCLSTLQSGPVKSKPTRKKKGAPKRRKASPKVSSPLSTPKPRRKSRRLSKKAETESEESEDEEMELDSDTEPVLKRPRSPSPVEFQNSPEISAVKRLRQ